VTAAQQTGTAAVGSSSARAARNCCGQFSGGFSSHRTHAARAGAPSPPCGPSDAASMGRGHRSDSGRQSGACARHHARQTPPYFPPPDARSQAPPLCLRSTVPLLIRHADFIARQRPSYERFAIFVPPHNDFHGSGHNGRLGGAMGVPKDPATGRAPVGERPGSGPFSPNDRREHSGRDL